MLKNKIYNLIQLCMWIISFIGLVIIIAMPKPSETLLKSLYYLFVILLLIIPAFLCFLNALNYALHIITKIEAYMVMPLLGLSLYTLLSLIYFLSSLTSQGKLIMILAIIIYLIISVISSLFIMKMKQYKIKIHIILLIVNFVLYLSYFWLGVQISYDYSVNW